MLWDAVKSGEVMCSQQLYFEIKRIPEKDRSLKQSMQTNVFEMVDKWKSEAESNRKDLMHYKENLLLSSEQNERLMSEVDSLKRMQKTAREDTSSRLSDMERRESELLQRLGESETHLNEVRSKELN